MTRSRPSVGAQVGVERDKGSRKKGAMKSYRSMRTCSRILRLCDVVGLLFGVDHSRLRFPVPGFGRTSCSDNGAVIHGIFAPG